LTEDIGPRRLRSLDRSLNLARHNYGLEKRQRELNKERKKAEKLQRKLDRANDRDPRPDTDGSAEVSTDRD
jgi:hypothetical protein